VKRHRLFILAIALMMFGCAWLSVAEYDPAIEGGAEALHQKVYSFLGDLRECAGTPEGEYERHTEFYTSVRADLAGLRAIAETHTGNERTIRSLDDIGENLDELEALHREGVSSGEVALIAQLFDTQFRMLAELEKRKER
jgi:hypothetical protein